MELQVSLVKLEPLEELAQLVWLVSLEPLVSEEIVHRQEVLGLQQLLLLDLQDRQILPGQLDLPLQLELLVSDNAILVNENIFLSLSIVFSNVHIYQSFTRAITYQTISLLLSFHNTLLRLHTLIPCFLSYLSFCRLHSTSKVNVLPSSTSSFSC